MEEIMTLEEQIEYLEQAKDIVLEYQDASEETKEQQEIVDKLRASLQKEQKALEDKIQTTVRKRRGEIESSYDKQVHKVKDALDQAKERLDQARNKAINSHVANETRENRVEKTNLVTEIHSIYKRDRVPILCRNPLYFALHCPGSMQEILVLLGYILLCYVMLPAGMIYFMTDHSRFYIILIAVLDVLFWALLYGCIHILTRRNHKESLKQIRELKQKIRRQNKQIRKTEKQIRNSQDDSAYGLEEYKETLAECQADYDAVKQEQKDALNTFDQETRRQIEEELTANVADRLDDLTKRLEDSSLFLEDLRKIEQNLGRSMNERFANALGKEFLDPDRLDDLILEFKNGTSNMMEAQEKVRAGLTSGKKKR